jgi:hypothetical protein
VLSTLTLELVFDGGTAMTTAFIQVSIEREGSDIFVIANGVRIAKRGHPGTPQANTWLSLEPGWTVRSCDDGESIEVECKRQRMH